MTETFQGIVLQCVRHSDKTSVLTVYTPAYGTLPLAVPAGGSSRSRTKAATRMPLAQVEFSCTVKPGSAIQHPSALQLVRPYANLYFHPVKNALGIFIAEFLTRLLRDTPPDPVLFSYLIGSLRLLDHSSRGLANFHIALLSGLTGMLGIAPDVSKPSPWFDLRAGTYTAVHPGHTDVLQGPEARLPLILSRLNFSTIHRLRLTRPMRARLLDGILRYYSIHLGISPSFHSLPVLSQIFD